jgi:hypothetical protein
LKQTVHFSTLNDQNRKETAKTQPDIAGMYFAGMFAEQLNRSMP